MRSHQTIHNEFYNLPIPIEMGNARPLVEPNLPQLVLAETNICRVTYRFGFNGKENDNEVKGDGNSLDFGERIFDSRIARFFTIDPCYNQDFLISWSPYHYTYNNPLVFIDSYGRNPILKIVNGYKVNSGYSEKRLDPVNKKEYKPHHAVDIAAPLGTPVHTAARGVVIFSGILYGEGNTKDPKEGYGYTIMIRHPNGTVSRYSHMKRGSFKVAVGDVVTDDQIIGSVGSSGHSTAPHLDFGIVSSTGSPLNPQLVEGDLNQILDDENYQMLSRLESQFDDLVEKQSETVYNSEEYNKILTQLTSVTTEIYKVKERISKNIITLKPLKLSCGDSPTTPTTIDPTSKGGQEVVIQ